MSALERVKNLAKVIYPAKPYFPESDIKKIQRSVEKILKSGMLTLHTFTKDFESEFGKICGVKHSIAVNSGTSALEIVLRTMHLRQGDKVLVPTNTFSATAAAVIFAGAKPKLTDIDQKSLCIDVKNVEKNIDSKTRGVIVVHVGGLVCPEVEEIKELCEDRKLFLIEDAAHAHGSSINGKPAGSLGDAGCFSFHPTKVVTSCEGGMITTNDDQIDRTAQILRDQGKEDFNSNIIVELGNNWRLPEISAAVGLVQLERLPEMMEIRRSIARLFDRELKKIDGLEPLHVPKNIISNYYKYTVFLDKGIDREKVKNVLREKGVRCSGEVYWPPLHFQPIFKKLLRVREGNYPLAEEACKRMICLPLHVSMTMEDAKYVVQTVRETMSN
jgi:dTDP-4-amino-4,6-dideoxygalactose transaminase